MEKNKQTCLAQISELPLHVFLPTMYVTYLRAMAVQSAAGVRVLITNTLMGYGKSQCYFDSSLVLYTHPGTSCPICKMEMLTHAGFAFSTLV